MPWRLVPGDVPYNTFYPSLDEEGEGKTGLLGTVHCLHERAEKARPHARGGSGVSLGW